jgi:prepilin-type N-terminal cleavage/methylation domain-containing protein
MQCSAKNTNKNIFESGFTLIELLVVIAIIAIIAAFLFPVFGTIQENARQNNTLSHLHDVQLGLGLYQLDNKSYPPVLFAYACDAAASAADSCNVNDSMQTIAGDKHASNELVGLYPEYVKSWTSFEGNDDTLDDPSGKQYVDGTGTQPNYLCADGTLQPASAGATTAVGGGATCNTPMRAFFKKDAMDVGPQVSASHQLTGGAGNYTYVVRYQTSWTSWNGSFDPDRTNSANPNYYGAGSPWLNYTRQLAWVNPPSDTYVTAITTHIPNANKLIVLYQSGTAIKTDLALGSLNNTQSQFNETSLTNTPIGNIAPVSETNTANCQYTQPSTSSVTVPCNYVPSQFWGINTTGR